MDFSRIENAKLALLERLAGKERHQDGGNILLKARALTAIAGVAVCLGSLSVGLASASTKPKATHPAVRQNQVINVGTAGATGIYDPLYVGILTHAFTRVGLTVNWEDLTPTSCTDALLSGNIDIGFCGPDLVAGILSDRAAAIISTDGLTDFSIVGSKGLTSLSQLQGKNVAVTTPGGAIDQAVRAALTHAGLTPGVDVHIVYLSTNSAALAAVESGTASGAGVSPPTIFQATAFGLSVLANVSKYVPPADDGVNIQYATRHKAQVVAFLRAFEASTKVASKNRLYAEAALERYVGTTSPYQLDGTWNAYRKVWTLKPYPLSGIRATLSTLAHDTPPLAGASTAKPGYFVNNTYVKLALK